MGPVRRLVVSIVVAAFALVPAPALASSQDVTATHAAVSAGYTLARAAVAAIPVAEAKIQTYNGRLARECPGAGAGTPETEASEPMSAEVAAALWSIAYGSAREPIERFASAIRPLHWTSRPFDRAVHRYATVLVGLATLPLPHLCADVRAWTASAFTAIPSDVTELDRRVEQLELPEIPWGLVSRYEGANETGLVSFIEHAQRKVAEAEFTVGQKDWYQVIETVGLVP